MSRRSAPSAFPTIRMPSRILRRASEKLTPIRGMVGGNGADPGDRKFSWSIANPKWREWAGENREALELFLRGADQPDASNPAGEPTARHGYRRLLIMLAFLEASRRQESGDTAGAWDCYRAVLRMITHIRRRGSTLQRSPARGASRSLQRRLTDWAAEPRTTIPQLHTALEVVLENEPNPDWDIFAVKYGYLELMGALERPMPLSALQEIEGEWTFRLGDMSLSPSMVESSRGRAPLPLARARTQPARPAAALCQLPGARGNPRAAAAETGRLGDVVLPGLIESGHEAAKSACRFTPSVRRHRPGPARSHRRRWPAGWSRPSTPGCDSLRGYDEWLPPVRARDRRTVADRRAHRELVIMLATEIYRRERGSLPSSDEALVGTYLKSLPDDGSAELADGTTPTVE